MATHTIGTANRDSAEARPPTLETGDRLSRDEFERRYTLMPEVKKAELVEGIVYMRSPVSYGHAHYHSTLNGFLFTYWSATAGVSGGDNATVRLDQDNEYQPDICVRIETGRGGQAKIGEDGYVEGAPELVAEIATSSVSYDLHVKLKAYERNGVREYLVWRVRDQEIDWFVLRDGKFEPLLPDSEGVFKSVVFPGLWLDRAAILRGDLPTALSALRRGIDSPEHVEFVRRLAASG